VAPDTKDFSLVNETTECEFLSLHAVICYLKQETNCLCKNFNIILNTEAENAHILFSDELVGEFNYS
jgi:hypothetical protein